MSTVLVTGARAPVALHTVRLFGAAGWQTVLSDCFAYPMARRSRFCGVYERTPAPSSAPEAFADALAAVCARHKPDVIVPTSEEIFYVVWAVQARHIPVRVFAPGFETLRRAHNKAEFHADASSFSIPTPRTEVLTDAAGVAALRGQSGNLVFKPAWSRFAIDTLICPKPEALDRVKPTADAPWLAQEYLPGPETCSFAVAHSGKLSTLVSYRPLHRAGQGASVYFERVEDASVHRSVDSYIRRTGWTGQISFDFKTSADGVPHVLECNPRATSGIFYLGRDSGFAEQVEGGSRSTLRVDRRLMIPAAMWFYGLPDALRRGRIADWATDYAVGRDALCWADDRLPVWVQPASITELAALAVRNGLSMLEASTFGIAWNGVPIGSGRSLSFPETA